MIDPHVINTEQPQEVADAVKAVFRKVWGEGSFSLLDRAFRDVTELFEGRYPGYQAIDMEYHDYEHTLQATLCLTHLLEGRALTDDVPVFVIRDWELAVIAALLHDTGFLKKTGDNVGTGAKYTFVHERRSCDFARAYLPQLGLSQEEIEDVCSAIMCTGPRSQIGEVVFRCEETRIMAYFLVTADYLAQISAADYLEKLPRLYLEFQESFAYNRIPPEDRPYGSLRKLLEMTPGFWVGYVLPVLNDMVGGVYRYLSHEGQSNLYMLAAEANVAELMRRLEAGEV
ncbi:MAG: hypothetical protein RLZZ505_1418 [Verrucomicrobiota bacterium]|jgi:hypothetical protein